MDVVGTTTDGIQETYQIWIKHLDLVFADKMRRDVEVVVFYRPRNRKINLVGRGEAIIQAREKFSFCQA